jgi:hypothetical protein
MLYHMNSVLLLDKSEMLHLGEQRQGEDSQSSSSGDTFRPLRM